MNEKLVDHIETLLQRIETLEKEVSILKNINVSGIYSNGYQHNTDTTFRINRTSKNLDNFDVKIKNEII